MRQGLPKNEEAGVLEPEVNHHNGWSSREFLSKERRVQRLGVSVGDEGRTRIHFEQQPQQRV